MIIIHDHQSNFFLLVITYAPSGLDPTRLDIYSTIYQHISILQLNHPHGLTNYFMFQHNKQK